LRTWMDVTYLGSAPSLVTARRGEIMDALVAIVAVEPAAGRGSAAGTADPRPGAADRARPCDAAGREQRWLEDLDTVFRETMARFGVRRMGSTVRARLQAVVTLARTADDLVDPCVAR
jgi:hypothetical protein